MRTALAKLGAPEGGVHHEQVVAWADVHARPAELGVVQDGDLVLAVLHGSADEAQVPVAGRLVKEEVHVLPVARAGLGRC